MDTMPLAEIELITKIAQNITVISMLLWAVSAFYKGDIVSRKTMEQIISGIIAQIDEKMETKFDEMGKKIDKLRGW
jgi:hypothetical protein